jgi:hypothetical protein
MAVDPSIALGVKPLEVANPFTQFAQVTQLQGAQQANQLNQMKMAEYERARQEEEGIRNYLAGKELGAPETRNGLMNFGKTGLEYSKALAEQDKSTAALQEARLKNAASKVTLFRDALADVNTPQQAAAWITAQHQDPDLKPIVGNLRPLDQALANIPTDPKGFQDWKMKNGLGMTKFIERSTMTAAEKAADERARESNRISRERLNAEMATGVLTPASMDLAANIYLQTGQLPTGLGKSAANLRSQVMNRATELSTNKPAAEMASGIVEAKQDVASRGKAVKDFATGIQGRQVNAFNTAIDHLGTMDKLTDALSNGDLKAINTVGNVIARQTGAPAPTNFDAAKQIVTAEVIKAVVASGGGVTERQEAERNFAAANSPEQLKGVINTYKQLLGGQLKSLNLQYENTTGRKDFDSKLTGEAKKVVQELRGGEAKPNAPAQTGKLSPAEQAELEQLRARFKK